MSLQIPGAEFKLSHEQREARAASMAESSKRTEGLYGKRMSLPIKEMRAPKGSSMCGSEIDHDQILIRDGERQDILSQRNVQHQRWEELQAFTYFLRPSAANTNAN